MLCGSLDGREVLGWEEGEEDAPLPECRGREQQLSRLLGTPIPALPPNEPVNWFCFSIGGVLSRILGSSGFESLRPLDEELRLKP